METTKNTTVSSTIYTVYKETACEKHSVTIPGKAGYKISITKSYIKMKVLSKGTTATAWVNANGDQISKFTETSTSYKSKSATVNYTGRSGGSVVLDWYLLSSKSSSRVYMTEWYVSYDLVADTPDVEEPETQTENYNIVVSCNSKELDELISKVKSVATGKSVQIYKEV